MELTHTAAGNRWRYRLRRPDGSLSPRVMDPEIERQFWRQRMEQGPTPADDYADTVFRKVMELAESYPISSVLEIGPGWGNYTIPLCRRFPRVTAVDLSPDNLRCLEEATGREGNPITPICSPWEEAQPDRHDLVFAYNCFYRVIEPELFLQKINDSAKQLCIIGMGKPPELPWLPDLKAAGFAIHYTSQGCQELKEVLESLGIRPRLVQIPNHRTFRYADEEALLRRAEGFLMEPADRDRLLDILMLYHTRGADGKSLICSDSFLSQLLVWEP